MVKERVNIFWFRRDLRINDNKGLYFALSTGVCKTVPLFIFDDNILDSLNSGADKRISFMLGALSRLETSLDHKMLYAKGKPCEIFELLTQKIDINAVYCNEDYEPYAVGRDNEVKELLAKRGIRLIEFKDSVIFSKKEILKPDGKPYSVFTPYASRWKKRVMEDLPFYTTNFASSPACINIIPPPKLNTDSHRLTFYYTTPSHGQIGFTDAGCQISPHPHLNTQTIAGYGETRNYPHLANGTSRIGPYLRFGIVSIRELVLLAVMHSPEWLNELIWREFFHSVIYYFPHSANHPFKQKYSSIKWRNNQKEIDLWCSGNTGYPIVDAGMRELNETGYMHNRVRMITAGFFTKHLLADWRIGEAYFASKLIDYDLASNVGNWQWAAGCGCDAAPYFRIFNPYQQAKKFDPLNRYIHRWVPELKNGTASYPSPVVDHNSARERAIKTFRESLETF